MLTDTECRTKKATGKPLKLSDGKGLYLEIRPNGSRLWRYRYKLDGKENLFAMGEYCQQPAGESGEDGRVRREGRRFTLSEARSERERCRGLIKQNIHPSHIQRTERLRRSIEAESTFKAVAETWIAENKPHWSQNYLRQIEQRFASDTYPRIGDLPIKEVTPAHVKDVLKRVERRGAPSIAKLLRTWIGGVFRYAAGELIVETDPTWPLRNTIKAPKTRHIPHLTVKEIPGFLQALDRVQAEYVTACAVKLLWLTAVRTVELRGMQWGEIDFDTGVWTVPAERMKMREKHLVPLPTQAIELLRALHSLTGRGAFVFSGRKDREQCLTYEAIRDVFDRAGYAGRFSPHGIRGTFSTYFNEAGADRDTVEMILAHKDRDAIRAAYNHARRLTQRRALLQKWADLSDAWREGTRIFPFEGHAA